MSKGRVQRKSILAKKLRLPIALLIFLSVLFFFLFKRLSERIEPGILFSILPLIFITLISVIMVIILVTFFTQRLTGPFERLIKEIDNIRTGNYITRLHIRQKDDKYLRSFVSKINNLLDGFEKINFSKEELLKTVDIELSEIISTAETKEALKERRLESIISLHKKVKAELEEK